MDVDIFKSINGSKLKDLWDFKVVYFPPELVVNIVILLHFMPTCTYQEYIYLICQDHAVCGNDGSNWYTVQHYTVNRPAVDLCYLFQAIHKVGTIW